MENPFELIDQKLDRILDLLEFNGEVKSLSEKEGASFLNRKEAAKRLSIKVGKIDEARRRGKLVAKYVGRTPLFKVEDVENLPEEFPI